MSIRAQRRGFLLIIVLIVVMVLALGAYAFSDLMLSHRRATQLAGDQVQCRLIVDSGVESVRLFLAQDRLTQRDFGGTFDNPDMFRGVLVVDDLDEKLRGRYTLIATGVDDEGGIGGVRFGLENESTRLNLNALLILDQQLPGTGRKLLMCLPGCTEEIADAILDWMDDDDEPREFGAEIDYYAALDPPYAPKNGPLDTVEELLLVRGVTPQLLFGEDVNRNGIVDAFEATGAPTTWTTVNQTLSLGAATEGAAGDVEGTITVESDISRGWSPYLTLFSMERNVNSQGQPRVYLNQTNMQQLFNQLSAVLPPEWATFIVAYKQNGPYTGEEEGEVGLTGPLDLRQAGNTKLTQVLDLIGAKVQVTFQGAQQPVLLESPFPDDLIAMGLYLPVLMDNCTVNPGKYIPGRINLNQASKTVLAGVPGMTEDILAEIISRRNFEPPDELINRRYETWILAEGIVTLAEMRTLMPFLTGGGDVHRAQVVGYFQGGTASSRAEVIWDATPANPRILFWRDLSHLGRGFALETLGIDVAEVW